VGELFKDASANYCLLTSKRHEGFSLLDTAYSDRNSVKLGPHQDPVRELFAADRPYMPQIHRGVLDSRPADRPLWRILIRL
jgi:alpha-L-fucosidase